MRSKILNNPEKLKAALRKQRHGGGKIVFTNGCFDMLHPGHVELFHYCKNLGRTLVVGINSDASVKRLKGDQRPVCSQQDRAFMVAALHAVSYVYIFDEDTPIELIKVVRPDYHVKGGDYKADTLPETPIVRELGGEVRIFPTVKGYSTTSTIAKLANSQP